MRLHLHRRQLSGLFVTGTDTGVGKTLVSCALLEALRRRGLRAAGMKPVASGAVRTATGLRNEDALALQRYGMPAPYEVINPFVYEPPIAPHLAAAEAQRPISMDVVEARYRELAAQADLVVVEGAGGWRVPLDESTTLAEIPRRLELAVVLVVGLRLGCLSHALLTAEAIRTDGLRLVAWAVSCIEPPGTHDQAQIETLERRLEAPLLGVLPHVSQPSVEGMAAGLDLAPLLQTEGNGVRA